MARSVRDGARNDTAPKPNDDTDLVCRSPVEPPNVSYDDWASGLPEYSRPSFEALNNPEANVHERGVGRAILSFDCRHITDKHELGFVERKQVSAIGGSAFLAPRHRGQHTVAMEELLNFRERLVEVGRVWCGHPRMIVDRRVRGGGRAEETESTEKCNHGDTEVTGVSPY